MTKYNVHKFPYNAIHSRIVLINHGLQARLLHVAHGQILCCRRRPKEIWMFYLLSLL